MMFEWVFLLGAILVGAVWLARGGSLDGLGVGRGETPVEILDRRLAEGAITIDEYHARRAVLAGRASPGQPEGASR